MPPALRTLLRSTIAQAIIDDIGPGAKLRVYGPGYTPLLLEYTGADPFGTETTGLITAEPMADATGLAAGNATLARIFQADGSTIVINSLSVGDSNSSADLKLNQVGVHVDEGQTVVLDTFTIAVGNA